MASRLFCGGDGLPGAGQRGIVQSGKMKRLRSGWNAVWAAVLLLSVAGVAVAQWRGDASRERFASGERVFPRWDLSAPHTNDCLTFARIRWTSITGRRSQTWETDFPDSDQNFSYRLQQLTSLRVDPDGVVIELTDPALARYPFVWMSGVGGIRLNEQEVTALRRYLLAGGFLWVDDFWGEEEWRVFYGELKRVLPDAEPVDLPLEHPIFSFLYRLERRPQIPNVFLATRNRGTGVTWERQDAREPHYRAVLDSNQRIMVMICHNTDLGDGWEEETTNPYYFSEFSEKSAYPLGINILLYAMTH